MNQDHRSRATRNGRERVRPLSDLHDLEIEDGDPDVRGWTVVASGGARIGAVKDLLVDREAMRVSHLDVELRGQADAPNRTANPERFLVPVGAARLNDRREEVLLPMTAAEAAGQLTWDGGILEDGEGADGTLLDERESAGRPHIRTTGRPRPAPPRG